METKDSSINRAIGRQIKREKSDSKLSVKKLADLTGIGESTINKMWSDNPRDINITQLTWLAALLGTTPQQVVEDALARAGGLEAVMAELRENMERRKSNEMSDAPATTDDLGNRRLQREAEKMSPAEIEEIAIAATTDAERRTDEPSAP